LQFQKTLRLQEAQRLLMCDDVDASLVASKVGYEDASQFSREYKRAFGEPPKRDVFRLKQLVTTR
jgi:transcriptional regulator GlxA family with amidase domain